MKKALVSIIMNCLNGAQDLPEALRSLKAQTFQDFEIIFLDNASTDKSAAIAKAYGPQLRYFRNEQTRPLGAARNQALRQAEGKYIAFLDCDDVWQPEKLAKQLELFNKNPALGLACTDTEIFKGNKKLGSVFEGNSPARGMVFEELVARQWISMSSAMLSREALESVREAEKENAGWFDERLNVCEEADLFYRIAHDWEVDYVPEPLTRWRVHSQNTTFQKFHQFSKETQLILEKHLRLYPDYKQNHAKLIKLFQKRAAFQGALALWKSGKNNEARKSITPYLAESKKYKLFWLATFLPGSLFDFCGRLYFALPASLRK